MYQKSKYKMFITSNLNTQTTMEVHWQNRAKDQKSERCCRERPVLRECLARQLTQHAKATTSMHIHNAENHSPGCAGQVTLSLMTMPTAVAGREEDSDTCHHSMGKEISQQSGHLFFKNVSTLRDHSHKQIRYCKALW